MDVMTKIHDEIINKHGLLIANAVREERENREEKKLKASNWLSTFVSKVEMKSVPSKRLEIGIFTTIFTVSVFNIINTCL